MSGFGKIMFVFSFCVITFFCGDVEAKSLVGAEVQQTDNVVSVNHIMSAQTFKELREYVFQYGDQKEYCVNSGVCPHLKAGSTKFSELFFATFAGKQRPRIEDYTVLYINTEFNGMPTMLYLYVDSHNNVKFFDFKREFLTPELQKQAMILLKDEIDSILYDVQHAQ